jgi:ribose transport system ATP-binding protein
MDPRAEVRSLSVARQQMVEIAKALSFRSRILVMDEPTAALNEHETAELHRIIRGLTAEGVGVVYISHKMDEIRRISDRVTVMRDGRVVLTAPASDLSEDAMANAMVGRDLSDLFPRRTTALGQDVALRVRDLTVPGRAEGVTFDLRRGEILGIAGLVGSGRTEAMEGLVGLRRHTGHVEIEGRPVTIRSPREAQALGLVYLTEDRKGRGLVLNMGMKENLTLQSLGKFAKPFLDRKAEDSALDKAVRDFDIRAPSRSVRVRNLSGGNQQKLLIAKIMQASPRIVIIDEPTRGIDIGTKQQIYDFIHRLSAEGVSVIVISSELPEVIGLSDRVLVMRQGRLMGAVEGQRKTEDAIVRLAMGLPGAQGEAA